MSKKAAAYYRFSSDNQRTESIDAQRRAVHEYCSANDIEIVEEYVDEAYSAKSSDRPSFQRMIRDSAKREFEIIVVHKLDRFARNRQDSAMYRIILQKNGVVLRSVIENFDDSPESVILESLMEGLAEYYSKNLAREVMKGMKENAYNGKHTGGYVPFGYNLTPDKKIEINVSEATAVRKLFDMVLEGKSYREIAEYLNGSGFRTRGGHAFNKNSIYEMLHNKKYIGICIYNKRVAEVNGHCSSRKFKDESEWIINDKMYPAIVDKDKFDRVQEMMKKRAVGNRSANTVYLLKGKIFCGLCGTPYAGNRKISGKGSVSFYYSCNRPKALGKCSNRSVRKDIIEQFVLNKLAEYVFSDSIIPGIVAAYNTYLKNRNGSQAQRITELKSELRKTESKAESIAELLIESKSKTLLAKLDEYEKRAAVLRKEIRKLESDSSVTSVTEKELKTRFAEIREKIRSGETYNIRALIEQFVHRVNVYPDRIEVIFNFYPDKVKYIPKTTNEGRADARSSLFVPGIMIAETSKDNN